MNPTILFEDKHLIVCVKPPGVPAQPDPTGDESLFEALQKLPHNSKHTLGLVHRLDRPVGGVMVFARNREASAQLNRQMQQRAFDKQYLTVVCGVPPMESGSLTHFLLKNGRTNTSAIVNPGTKDSKEAILHYRCLGTLHDETEGDLSLLSVTLETGRHHQIRVQLAGANLPIWGDTKYNPHFSNRKGWYQIALWAHKLSFQHPLTRKPLSFEAQPSEHPFSLF